MTRQKRMYFTRGRDEKRGKRANGRPESRKEEQSRRMRHGEQQKTSLREEERGEEKRGRSNERKHARKTNESGATRTFRSESKKVEKRTTEVAREYEDNNQMKKTAGVYEGSKQRTGTARMYESGDDRMRKTAEAYESSRQETKTAEVYESGKRSRHKMTTTQDGIILSRATAKRRNLDNSNHVGDRDEKRTTGDIWFRNRKVEGEIMKIAEKYESDDRMEEIAEGHGGSRWRGECEDNKNRMSGMTVNYQASNETIFPGMTPRQETHGYWRITITMWRTLTPRLRNPPPTGIMEIMGRGAQTLNKANEEETRQTEREDTRGRSDGKPTQRCGPATQYRDDKSTTAIHGAPTEKEIERARKPADTGRSDGNKEDSNHASEKGRSDSG